MRNFPAHFWQRFQSLKEDDALVSWVDGTLETDTYWDWTRRVQRVAVKLREDGLQTGDRVAMIAPNSRKWLDMAFGAWLAGACLVPVSPKLDRKTTLRCLARTGCRWIAVQDSDAYNRIRGQGANIPEHLEWILLDWDGESAIGDATTLTQLDGEGQSLVARGRVDDLAERIYDIDKDAPAVVFFEEQPGDDPHGAFFSGKKLAGMLDAVAGSLPLGENTDWAIQSSFANPRAFLIALAVLFEGRGLAVDGRPGELMDQLLDVHPTHLVCDSELLESKTRSWRQRIQDAPEFMQEQGEENDSEAGAKQSRDAGAFSFGKLLGAVGERAAERLFYRPLRNAFGGELQSVYVPGQGVSEAVEEVMESADTAVLDVFGLPECGISHLEHAGSQRRGAVGRPVHGYKCRIDDSGEILIKSDVLFDDYWDETGPRRVDQDGWLHTGLEGDIRDGYLYLR